MSQPDVEPLIWRFNQVQTDLCNSGDYGSACAQHKPGAENQESSSQHVISKEHNCCRLTGTQQFIFPLLSKRKKTEALKHFAKICDS